jgi:hypothetical protein
MLISRGPTAEHCNLTLAAASAGESGAIIEMPSIVTAPSSRGFLMIFVIDRGS